MISTLDVAGFLSAGGVSVPIVREGDVIRTPQRCVEVTATGGAGTSHERLFDRAAVQIRVRGDQGDHDSAEALATQVDAVLMGAAAPMRIGGRPVVRIDYLGGPPAFVTRDEARRTVLACTYLIEIARG